VSDDELPLGWRIRRRLSELLPRWLAVWLGIRRLSPALGQLPPGWTVIVPRLDTGGGYRAAHRRQDPAADPSEPFGSESSSTGNDHGWSGCTMSAGADAIAYQSPQGSVTPWGGDLRHRQGDLSGGTDLYDLRAAWAELGETLTIRSGAGWSGVVAAHDEGRAIVAQGTGNVPGSQSFDGGHACSIPPESHTDGRWLFGDPLASDWQWVEPSAIRSWMERMSSGCYFAVGEKGDDMARFVQANGYGTSSGKLIDVPAGADWFYLDGSKGGDYSKPATLRVVGIVDGHPGDWCVIGATGKPYDDGGTRDTLIVIKGGEPYDAPPPPPPGGDDLGSRQAQWDADARAVLGSRPA
jgi:hypothetical protein